MSEKWKHPLSEALARHAKDTMSETSDVRARLATALRRYEAMPINAADRPESWARLDELLAAAAALLAQSAPAEYREMNVCVNCGADPDVRLTGIPKRSAPAAEQSSRRCGCGHPLMSACDDLDAPAAEQDAELEAIRAIDPGTARALDIGRAHVARYRPPAAEQREPDALADALENLTPFVEEDRAVLQAAAHALRATTPSTPTQEAP
jgi:hypothetical protein